MLHQESVPATRDRPIALPSETVIVETRFGTYEFAPQETITMPNGLIGFGDQRLFGLGNLPAPVPADFKLLQSLDDVPISFIVMAASVEEAPVAAADLDEACAAGGFARDDVAVLFLCTIRPKDDGDGVDMWVNLRAPILFDLEARRGRQHVLSNSEYSMHHPLSKWDGEL